MTDINPHPVDENPEHFIGETMKDPWDDEAQTDWPNEIVNVSSEVTE